MSLNKIIQLDPEVINKIAAGEVVERPQSVIRELVENSIDAGATNISILLKNGGLDFIEVSDNGCGMTHQDAELSILRHATSKIKNIEDLFNIETLGFRGEALAAISSVSQFTLTTKNSEDLEGISISFDSIGIKKEAIARNQGTTIAIRNLFYNVPARRKFLKSISTEYSHVLEFINRIAIINPSIHFLVTHQDKTIYSYSKSNSMSDRIKNVMELSHDDQLYAFESQYGEIHLSGYYLNVEKHVSQNPNQIYIYINGRYVKDRYIQHAVMNAYRTVIMVNSYPTVFLFINIDPKLIDFNVHPAKSEVRFARQKDVYDLVFQTLRENLSKGEWNKVSRSLNRENLTFNTVRDSVIEYSKQSLDFKDSPAKLFDTHVQYRQVQQDISDCPEIVMTSPPVFRLQYVGQIKNTYLVFQDDGRFILVDQHAAHERILFEKYKKDFTDNHNEQVLLIPQIVEFKQDEITILEDQLTFLRKYGFELERFEGNTVVIKKLPMVFDAINIETFFRELIASIKEIGAASTPELILDKLFSLMACHNAIRANQPLSRDQSIVLMQDLDKVDFSTQCPHGRPVVVEFPFAEVEKRFKRVV